MERDTLGEEQVPAEALYGAVTPAIGTTFAPGRVRNTATFILEIFYAQVV